MSDIIEIDALPDRHLVLVLAVAEGFDVATLGFNPETRTLAAAAVRSEHFSGKAGSSAQFFYVERRVERRVVLIGLGPDGDSATAWAKAGSNVAKLLKLAREDLLVLATAIELRSFSEVLARRFTMAFRITAWPPLSYQTTAAAAFPPGIREIAWMGARRSPRHALHDDAVLEGIALARGLVAEPGNLLFPQSFVERCAHLSALGIGIRVLDAEEMANLGMNALLAVARGSSRPPLTLCLEWRGGKDGEAPLAILGKGVTFDSGGLSLKPAAGMEAMKWDMGGAAAVVGTMLALALRNSPTNVVGVCGLVENMPDGNAQRPGDVVTTMSGKTVEVINTDAEGRLVLCDLITWVQTEYAPASLIDVATLTGIIILALGHHYGGLFTDCEHLAEGLRKAGHESGEPIWRMPLTADYFESLKSDIADFKNIGAREGGASSAASFLHQFVEGGVKWAHLDIAGVAWADEASHPLGRGATGYGVRLLDQFIFDSVEGRNGGQSESVST